MTTAAFIVGFCVLWLCAVAVGAIIGAAVGDFVNRISG